jgi:hypothetical protein
MTNASAVPSTPSATSAAVAPSVGVWPGCVAIATGSVITPATVTEMNDDCVGWRWP